MTRIRHAGTRLVHEAKLNTRFGEKHYDFLCKRWGNLGYYDNYEKADDDTPVTCKGCLRRMRRSKD